MISPRFTAVTGASDVAGNITYHGGPVMHRLKAYLIFWRPDGYTFESNGSDQSYMSLIMRYFQRVGGSDYARILTQYGDATGPIRAKVSLGGAVLDTDPYPHAGTMDDPLFDSDLQNEINIAIQAEGWSPGMTTMFFIFTASGVQSCADSSGAQCSFTTYCAYHSVFSNDGVTPIIYAAMPDVDGSYGCMAAPSSPHGDMVADNEMIGLSHEQFEAETDPLGYGGWYNSDLGAEIGDLCHDAFGPLLPNGGNVILHGDPYLVQAEWSNTAHGCVVGPGPKAVGQG